MKSTGEVILSVVIPTYNEAENILQLIDAIRQRLPIDFLSEIIIVDDNSPDGTGEIVEKYVSNSGVFGSRQHASKTESHTIKVENNVLIKTVHQKMKGGLISAVLKGIEASAGQAVLVMDADFSHPPELIPKIIDELNEDPNCVIVASRYVEGGSIAGWSYRRRLISSAAVQIARYGLKIHDIKDPLSGYFAFPRRVIENIRFDTRGYKILLELLVKLNQDVKIKEIPYAFTNRKAGSSKLSGRVVIDYAEAVWHLYRYGNKASDSTKSSGERRKSVLFLSKAGRFFTVGASGLLINYVISFFLSSGVISNIWYINASFLGIIASITSNFILNKAWTFEDMDFSARHTLKQYGLFLCSSSVAAAVQLILVYFLVESYHVQYGLSLILAVATASVGNFLLSKKWTFKEMIWG